jgi:hypothetical protein
VNKYLTRLTLTPAGSKVDFGGDQPQLLSDKVYNWSYQFSNGSCLVGKVTGQLASDGNTFLYPTEISANYLAQDGETVLKSWVNEDFVSFESSQDGTNLLIIASDDNFVGNSMCLVESPFRKRAQVSDLGQQLVGETLHQEAWTLKAETVAVTFPIWEIDWHMIPLFPFVAINLNLRLSPAKMSYQWALFPWFCPVPLVQVAA